MKLDKVRKLVASIEYDRTPLPGIWSEMAEYFLPRHHLDKTKTDNKASHTIDSTCIRALQILAQGMMAGLTSPAKPWFRLKLADQYGPETEPERNWLNTVESRIYAALARSNFYPTVHSAYAELAAFGSTNIYQKVDKRRLMRFTLVPCGNFAWAYNDDGRVETVVRYRTMTARQIAERYGEEAMSKRTRRLLHENPEKRVEIVHMVRPRKNKKNAPDAIKPMEMPWESLVWEADSPNNFLHEGGYEELPHLTARWEMWDRVPPYGYSPAMLLLRYVYNLEELTRRQLLAIHEATLPTETAPKKIKSWIGTIATGGLGRILPRQCKEDAPLYQIKPHIAEVGREIEEVRTAIRKGLYNDFFLMFTTEGRSNVEATEVIERDEETLLTLSPVIERIQDELLNPLIERSYGMLKRAGMLPTPPCDMEGKTLNIEYISPLAVAQRELAEKKLHAFFTDVQKTFCGRD